MKRLIAVFGILTILLALTPTIPVSASNWTSKRWALIAAGDSLFDITAVYAKSMLEKYAFDEINYLGVTYLQELRAAIIGLKDKSDSDDLIFIYIGCHGGGYDSKLKVLKDETLALIDGSRGDLVDEGLEVSEADVMKDLNGDGNIDSNVIVGVDEFMMLGTETLVEPERYWDDEAREDLAQLNGHYWRLIFLYDGCKEENATEGCYSGGFIRDLSAPGRIIITPSNETEVSCIDPETHFSFFHKLFFDALDPDNDAFAVADWNDDERVSMWEAFQYAWIYDPKRRSGDEHPQIDDNGDGMSYPENHGQPGELNLALNTYLIPQWNTNDIVGRDGLVDVEDVMVPALAFGTFLGHPNWDPLADVTNDGVVDIDDVITVTSDFGEYCVVYPYWKND